MKTRKKAKTNFDEIGREGEVLTCDDPYNELFAAMLIACAEDYMAAKTNEGTACGKRIKAFCAEFFHGEIYCLLCTTSGDELMHMLDEKVESDGKSRPLGNRPRWYGITKNGKDATGYIEQYDGDVREMAAEGRPVKEIAWRIGFDQASVSQYMKRHGIVAKREANE